LTEKIIINGIVQGIGFRPFVYRLARESQLGGYVLNSSSGVEIVVQGKKNAIDHFIRRLKSEHPPAALVRQLSKEKLVKSEHYESFTIKQSQHHRGSTLISPDLAICSDCLRELFDPDDPRYGYSFINCTNCGPRYSIIENLPYDRPLTSMKAFPMCDFCTQEYKSPANRRFHAQPVACQNCGPELILLDNDLKSIPGNPIVRTRDLLLQGKIVGIKGIGGFHLACNPYNQQTVIRLRKLKQRPHKPFAVMIHPDYIRRFVKIDPKQLKFLASPSAPILILPTIDTHDLVEQVAPDQPNLGVFFPYAPHHFQLLNCDLPCLIMTSGNLKDGPIAKEESELNGLCDFFLTHNRPILNRSDDSVLLPSLNDKFMMVRRSRGFIPRPLKLNFTTIPALGSGAQLKLTFSLTKNDHLFTSPYIGNSDTKENFDFYLESLNKYKKWFEIDPQVVACDLQPDFMSTQYAEDLDIPLIRVQHHHAHIAAVMAEYGVNEPVIGIAYDGTGYGTDGAIWGGEIMLADYLDFNRLFHLDYMPLPGGDSAIRHPKRIAFAYLSYVLGSISEFNLKGLSDQEKKILSKQIQSNFNVFQTSSMGRLFDCVSAMLGLYPEITYEAQSAIALENISRNYDLTREEFYDYDIRQDKIDIRPLIKGIYNDLSNSVEHSTIAGRFHKTVIRFTVDVIQKSVRQTGIRKIVLCGGVMQNRILLKELTKELTKRGYSVYLPKELPVNDGSISAGQVMIANRKTKEG